MLIALCLLRLKDLSRGALRHYELTSISDLAQRVLIGIATALSIIPLFQLQARLAQSTYALAQHGIAPYEVIGYLLACGSWAAVLLVYHKERAAYTPTRTWALRMPVLATFAGQLAKLRIVLALTGPGEHNYFFWLFIIDTLLQGFLAAASLLWTPRKEDLQLACDLTSDYEVLTSTEPAGTRLDDDVCPEATAGFWSTLTFEWITPLLATGFKAPLDFSNLWQLPPDDRVDEQSRLFRQYWREQVLSGKPSLFMACYHTVSPLFISAIPFKVANDAGQFIGPVFLNLLLKSMDSGAPAIQSYGYAIAMFAGMVGGIVCDAQHFQRVMRAGFRIRSVIIAETFRKILFLTPTGRASFSRGYVYNLTTSDVDTLQMFSQQVFSLFSSPARIAVAMVLLYMQLGISSLAALFLLILVMPLQMMMVKLSTAILRSSKKFSDERTKLESDLVVGIEAVKSAAWERAFVDRVLVIRNQELALLWRGFKVAALNTLLLQTIPTLVMVVTFSVYVLLGNELTAAKAFTALALFTVLRVPLFMLPQVIQQATTASVALKRIQEFMVAEAQSELPVLPAAAGDQAIAARIRGTFRWADDLPPVLSDINLTVFRNELVVVVGATGAGKSSLLSILLGILQADRGTDVLLRGRVAYVSQSAFIFGGTVRDNITFYQPWDPKLYEQALHVACLGPDLMQLPAGDQTELGESGINVSGGQKQRIQIARAVYAKPQVLLLDDPLSALDAKVGRQVFENFVQGDLKDTTRLLVTNQLQFASAADKIVFLANGTIAEVGTYAELMAKGGAFAAMMAESQADASEAGSTDLEEGKQGTTNSPEKLLPESSAATSESPSVPGDTPTQAPAALTQASGALTVGEARATGTVALKVLTAYVDAMGGGRPFGFIISLFLIAEGLRVMSTLWLSIWTSDPDASDPRTETSAARYYLTVFTVISAGQVLAAAVNQYSSRYLSVRAARSMHEGMLGSLVRAPMSFFHSNPSGRIINRLTKDTSEIDTNLAAYASMAFQSLLQLCTTAVLIGSVTPFALPLLVPVLLGFYMLYIYFQASVREVKRLDALSRSPIFSCVSDATNGLATIRSFRVERHLISRLASLVDNNSVMQLTNNSLNRWLAIRLESLGALVAFATAVLAVEQGGRASWLGLTLTYALQMTAITTMTVRIASIAENCFNSVERVDEYSHIPSEAPAVVDSVYVDPQWPSRGQIDFQDVSMRYRPGLPLVLKNLTLKIEPGSKVGVVGRTGAGKSTIINTLFRLTEPASGKILIDDVDICTLGLARLRSSMALIPQAPVIFTGTLRENLNPFNQHTEAELWTALKRAHLSAVVEAQPAQLDMHLSEGGAPFSAGQRQLVALTRALLRHSKVLILDEATANVDVETDALIQKTIRSEFSDATQVSIAHRLHTIIDCDRVLVMHAGTAAEYGSPAELLSNPDGHFSSIVRETGPSTEAFLRSVALGDVDLGELRDAAAQVGMEHLQEECREMKARDMAALSTQVMQSARAAAGLLSQVLAFLDDQERTQDLVHQHSMDPGSLLDDEPQMSDAHGAMSEAATVVATLEKLAQSAWSRLCGAPTTPTADAAPAMYPPAISRPGELSALPPLSATLPATSTPLSGDAPPARTLKATKSIKLAAGPVPTLAHLDSACNLDGPARPSLISQASLGRSHSCSAADVFRRHVTVLRAASRFRGLASKPSGASVDLDGVA